MLSGPSRRRGCRRLRRCRALVYDVVDQTASLGPLFDIRVGVVLRRCETQSTNVNRQSKWETRGQMSYGIDVMLLCYCRRWEVDGPER